MRATSSGGVSKHAYKCPVCDEWYNTDADQLGSFLCSACNTHLSVTDPHDSWSAIPTDELEKAQVTAIADNDEETYNRIQKVMDAVYYDGTVEVDLQADRKKKLREDIWDIQSEIDEMEDAFWELLEKQDSEQADDLQHAINILIKVKADYQDMLSEMETA